MDPLPGISISASMPVEDLLERYPAATRLLLQRGVPCLVCGEPVWGTLGDVLKGHGKQAAEIDVIVQELRNELEAGPQ